MNVLALDIPLLIIGLMLLVYVRLSKPPYVFQTYCQMVSTISAQYSLIVSFSLGKIAPLFAATSIQNDRNDGLKFFRPFFIYAVVSGLLFSMNWKIPPGVMGAYGDYRIFIQLFNLTALAICTAAFARAMQHPNGPTLLFDLFTGLVLLHGVASAYQLVADATGLPLIAISRPHVEDLDTAWFHAGTGDVLRPGGLAGEPKTVAVIFGTYLLVRMFVPMGRLRSRVRRLVDAIALFLGSLGFLVTYSTSAYLGLILGGLALALRLRSNILPALLKGAAISVIALIGWVLLTKIGHASDLVEILRLRTVDRLSQDMDTPVAVALEALHNDPWVALLGTGIGGSTFLVMSQMGVFNLSYTPNIILIVLLAETGIVGTLFLLLPFVWLYVKSPPSTIARSSEFDNGRLLLCIATGGMMLQLAGSGIPLGFPLSIGSLCAAYHLTRKCENSVSRLIPGQTLCVE